MDVRDIYTIKTNIDDQLEKHIGDDEKLITATDIDIEVPDDNKYAVRDMLRKHEHIGYGQLGKFNVTKMRIDFAPDTKQIKYLSFHAGPKTRDLEHTEINKKLKGGVVELAM